MAGLYLDPWQQRVIIDSLGEKPDGTFSASDVGIEVSRQNGKGALLTARELIGVLLLEEELIVHSAHQFDTSLEAFRRLLGYIEDTPEIDRRVRRVSRSHGEEGVEFRNGSRVRFRTRTKGGGRGFSADCVILDEAMIIPESAHAALLPTLSAMKNPQIWYTGSAVDQEVHEHGVVFARVRERGHAGDDPSLAWFEWSAAESMDELRRDPAAVADPAIWAKANPALGIRITTDTVERERRAMSWRSFAVERLGVGDWPRTDERGDRLISQPAWAACADPESQIDGLPAFGVDVTPERTFASIAVAGTRPDGRPHIEVVEHGPGTEWVVRRCAELRAAHRRAPVVVDPRGPAASLLVEFHDANVPVVELVTRDYANACGAIYDAIVGGDLRYPAPQPELDVAVEGAQSRPIGDAWGWARRIKAAPVDISPLVAATLALWGHGHRKKHRGRVISLSEVLANEKG